MNAWHPWGRLVLTLALSGLLVGETGAAMKVRVPGTESGSAPATSAPEGKGAAASTPGPQASSPGAAMFPDQRQTEKSYFIGTVIFSRGSQIVVEIPEGAKDQERFVVYDSGLRRRGQAIVSKGLDKGVFSLTTVGSFSVSVGDRLARESEAEAVYRVLKANRTESYREFLKIFPDSAHKPRIARELFRLAVRSSYPTFPGTSVKGRLRLAEVVGQEIPLGLAEVVVDRFVIARTDEKGAFLIEGLPKLELPVTLKLRIKDPKFEMPKEASLDLPASQFADLSAEIPVKLVPTVLAGRVLDERGAAIPGAEVWTEPYSMEALTDDDGSYRILRKKALDKTGAAERDEPLLGGDYLIYAHRKGYSVDRATLSAESFRSNPVPPIRLSRQDLRGEAVPSLNIDLKAYLEPSTTALAAPEGGAPKLNP